MTTDPGELGDETATGSPVHARDGQVVGHVKEVRGDLFKVSAPMQPDYWLSAKLVGSIGDGRVILTVDVDHLYRYKRYDFGRGPTAAGVPTDLPPDYTPATPHPDAAQVPGDHVPSDPPQESRGPA